MEKQKLSKSQKELINAGLQALASLEEGIKAAEKLGEKRTVKNMRELCNLVEEMMYCSEEEAEKKLESITNEMEDRCNLLIGQTIMAQFRYGKK